MDQGMPPVGGRTPCPALSAPSTFVLEAGGRSHCKAFGRALTSFSEKLVIMWAEHFVVSNKVFLCLSTCLERLQFILNPQSSIKIKCHANTKKNPSLYIYKIIYL
jgi:hypothetical protein